MCSNLRIPKYALVKWLSGEDSGKLSIVPISWLKNFELDKSLKDQYESVVVEWQDEKKNSLGGWACFDATVINISDSRLYLERQIASQVSLSIPSLSIVDNGSTTVNVVRKEVTYTELKVLSDGDDPALDETFSSNPLEEKEEVTTPAKRKLDTVPNGNETSEEPVCKRTFQGPILDDRDIELTRLRKENEELKRRLLEEIPALMKKMDNFLKNQSCLNIFTNGSQPMDGLQQQISGKVEILPGSGVCVDIEAWLSAKACKSASGFVSRLLPKLFDEETLLNSNLRGGASKLSPNDKKREKLDEVKISALKGATLSLYPDVKGSQFGMFVNQKLVNLRSRNLAAEKNTNCKAVDNVTKEQMPRRRARASDGQRPVPIAIVTRVMAQGKNSQEKEMLAREKTVPVAVDFNKRTVPDTAAEQNQEIQATTDLATVPSDDTSASTDSVNDFTTTPVPKPKGPAPSPVPPPAPPDTHSPTAALPPPLEGPFPSTGPPGTDHDAPPANVQR